MVRQDKPDRSDRDPIRPKPTPPPTPKPVPESPKTPNSDNPSKASETPVIGDILERVARILAAAIGTVKVAAVFVPSLRPMVGFLVAIQSILVALTDKKEKFMAEVDPGVKELKDVEIVVVALAKKYIKNKFDVTATLKDCIADKEFAQKFQVAIEGATDIPAEIKSISVGEVLELVFAALDEVRK